MKFGLKQRTEIAERLGFGAVVICAGMACGQANNGTNQGAPAAPAYKTEAPPPLPSNVNPAVPQPIGVVLQHSGGSLARVELQSKADPAVAGVGPASFFSVPESQPKVLRKHDLITIVVRENSQFSSNGETDLKHTHDLDAQIDSYVQLELAHMQLNEITPSTPMELKTSAARDFNGTAQVNRSDSITAQITAEVFDVKPNGTLVLRASEHLKTDEEEQTMTLMGTCRVEDIQADNTVLSTQLFDLSLNKTHTGAVRDTTERGWITRILDTINPF